MANATLKGRDSLPSEKGQKLNPGERSGLWVLASANQTKMSPQSVSLMALVPILGTVTSEGCGKGETEVPWAFSRMAGTGAASSWHQVASS